MFRNENVKASLWGEGERPIQTERVDKRYKRSACGNRVTNSEGLVERGMAKTKESVSRVGSKTHSKDEGICFNVKCTLPNVMLYLKYFCTIGLMLF